MEQFWKRAQKSTILTTYFQTWFPSAVRRLDTFNDQNPLRKRCRRPAKVLLTGFSKIQFSTILTSDLVWRPQNGNFETRSQGAEKRYRHAVFTSRLEKPCHEPPNSRKFNLTSTKQILDVFSQTVLYQNPKIWYQKLKTKTKSRLTNWAVQSLFLLTRGETSSCYIWSADPDRLFVFDYLLNMATLFRKTKKRDEKNAFTKSLNDLVDNCNFVILPKEVAITELFGRSNIRLSRINSELDSYFAAESKLRENLLKFSKQWSSTCHRFEADCQCFSQCFSQCFINY